MTTSAVFMDDPTMMSLSTNTTPSTARSRPNRIGFKKSMSRDKAACEYYSEEADLADGDLPSLGRPPSPTSIPYMKPSAIHSSESRVVSPSPTNNRSNTPVLTNKSKKGKGKSFRRKWKEEEVTITAPILSAEAKRKHKVFWSQMDSDDSDGEDGDNGNGTGTGTGNDNGVSKRSKSQMQNGEAPHRGRTLTRRSEQVEDDEGVTHGIITVLADMCSDCGWNGSKDEEGKEKNVKPDFQQRSLPTSSFATSGTTSRSFDYNQNPSMVDDEESMERYDDNDDDDSSMPSKGTLDTNHAPKKKTAYHTDAYENTAIEVEYYDSGVPDDEIDNLDEILQLDTSGDVSAFTTPQGKAASEAGAGGQTLTAETGGYLMDKSKSWSMPDKNAYLQAMARKAKDDFRKNKVEKRELDVTIEVEESDDDESIEGILGELEKKPMETNNNLEAISSFSSYPDLPPDPTGSYESLAFRKSRSLNFVSPGSNFTAETEDVMKNDYTSPAGVTEFPADVDFNIMSSKSSSDVGGRNLEPFALKKAQSDLPATNSPSNRSLSFNIRKKDSRTRGVSPGSYRTSSDSPYKSQSTGSILSLGKKKKSKGAMFVQIDDDEPTHRNEAISSERSMPIPNLQVEMPEPEHRPADDIFDFDESFEMKAPVSGVRLNAYDDSCDVSVLGSLITNAADVSVYTSATNATNGTNLSTSTRRRHRGAAKNRIAEEDADKLRPSGWLESIKAAAEKNQRRWDPKIGWVDYVDSDFQEETESRDIRIGRLKAPFAKRSNGGENGSTRSQNDDQSATSNVPFPSNWERDRDDMISVDGAATAATEVVSNKLRHKKEKFVPVLEDTGVAIQFNLGAEDTIQEEDEQESDDDNISEVYEEPVSKSEVHAEESAETPDLGIDSREHFNDTVEKDDLYDWIGTSNENYDDAIEENLPDTKYETTMEESQLHTISETPLPRENKVEEGDVEMPEEDAYKYLPSPTFSKPNFSPVQGHGKNANQDSFGDDFEGNNGSFDFVGGDNDNVKDEAEGVSGSFDDGFKVIKNSRGVGFDQKKLKPSRISRDLEKVGDQVSDLVDRSPVFKNDRSAFIADRSVASTNSVTSKAKSWMKKVEAEKKGVPKPLESPIFVSAADDNSTFEYKKDDQRNDENDSLFNFEKTGKPKAYVRKRGEKAAPPFVKKSDHSVDHNETMSEITTPSEASNSASAFDSRNHGSFFSRLQACTSPVFEEEGEKLSNTNSMPQAHLAFLRNTENGFTDMIKCGTPKSVDDRNGLPPRTPSAAGAGTKVKTSLASTYLEAIKQKTGSPSEWGSGKPPESLERTSSSNSTSSSKSESWQKFLEKRNKALATSSARRSNASSGSKAAGEYAAAKVNEIMTKISNEDEKDNSTSLKPPSGNTRIPRSLSAGRGRNSLGKLGTRDEAAKAAEDLAAARVEAMMAMMSDSTLEGEI